MPALDGKVAIVTGASRGIGRAIARSLAAEGAAVVVAARSETENPEMPGTIHAVAAGIGEQGGRALAVRCDVTSESDVDALVARTLRELGRIDVLVANAGIMTMRKVWETRPERWRDVLEVNLTGTFLCTRAVVPHLLERKGGSLIAISTTGVGMTGLGTNAYWVSKAAIERMYAGLAEELRPHGIAVNVLAPRGVVETEGWQKAGKGMRVPPDMIEPPEVMGRAAVILAAADASGNTGRVWTSRDLLDSVGPEAKPAKDNP